MEADSRVSGAKYGEGGAVIATIDGIEFSIGPNDNNSLSDLLEDWVAAGHGIEPYVPTPTDEDVNAERDRRINGGFTFEDVLYDSDAEARENIAGAYSAALTYVTVGGAADAATNLRWNDPDKVFEWIAHDNSTHPMTASVILAFGQAALAWKSAHIFAARALKDSGGIPNDFADDQYWPAQQSSTGNETSEASAQ